MFLEISIGRFRYPITRIVRTHLPPSLPLPIISQSARWLHTLDSRSLAILLLALSDLGATPPPEWVSLALETAHRQLAATDPPSAVAVLWAVSRFERQRASAASAASESLEASAIAAAGGSNTTAAIAAAGLRLPPRRRRLSSLSPEELLLVADDLGLGLGGGMDGRSPGSSAATPLSLRPPRKWLVRYSRLIKVSWRGVQGCVCVQGRLTEIRARLGVQFVRA